MGEVCRAKDTKLDREVAIKGSQERFFEREARAVAALNHPNMPLPIQKEVRLVHFRNMRRKTRA
jgi:serine/threonine protein kinase